MKRKEKFIFERRLASGGMAEIYSVVFKGVHGFKKRYALKRIRTEYSNNKEFIETLINEANTCVQLNHENIVQIHELNHSGGVYYILMEYIDGIDLERILEHLKDDAGELPLEYSLLITRQICQGLEYAHNKIDESGKPLEIVHRDISPHNILISVGGRVKITDFGIAKARTKTTKTVYGTLKGKYLYMSPEQAAGESVDYRSDIFSVGSVLYELITGKKLFDGESDIQIINNVRNADISVIDNDDLPNEIKNILKKALTKNKNKRYQSCAEMVSEINKYLTDSGTETSKKDLAKFIQATKKTSDKEKTDSADYPSELDGVKADRQILGNLLSQENLPFFEKYHSKFGLKYLLYAAVLILILGAVAVFVYKGLNGSVQKQDVEILTSAPIQAPVLKGTLEITTDPTEADITISIDGKNTWHKSPVTIEDIDLAGGTKKVGISITHKGYNPHNQEVLLSKDHNRESLNILLKETAYGRLEVFAKPWGYVTIPGIANKVTSPFRSSRVKPGKYKISVLYEPDNKAVSKEVSVNEDERTFCTVDFLINPPILKCK